MRVLIVSGRARFALLADACVYDAEDAAVAALDADLLTHDTDPETLAPAYDLVIVFALSFSRLDALRDRFIGDIRARSKGPLIGYVFGGYAALVKPSSNPIKRAFGRTRKRFLAFDRIYTGIATDVPAITDHIGVRTVYVPMAANVLKVDARPYGDRADRPIAINAFGRQKMEIVHALSPVVNTPESRDLLYVTNFIQAAPAADLWRYRAMFWQILRQSRLALCFDQFYANGGDAKLSYVGPRWFETLAAGGVVVGRAPPTPDTPVLLDWDDAAIELPDDPEAARDAVLALLADDGRIARASRAALVQMAAKHDWTHRVADMLADLGLAAPAALTARLEALAARSADLRAGG